MKKYLIVFSALPYPNGNLHLGHMLEFIQTDIWVRSKKKIKKFYFSGIDSHGTPIMLKALKEKKEPENLINNFMLSYKKNLKNLNINCSNFYTTHSYENEILTRKIFFKLYEKKLIKTKISLQLYDKNLKIFLPDRYIIGKCPKCYTENQHGDLCEKCNFNYNAIDLINPISKITNTKPIKKKTKNYYIILKKTQKIIKNWCNNKITQNEIKNKLKEWIDIGLKLWNISRNKPYFGIKIPNENSKFFYVWLDAPLGYFASAQNFFLKYNLNFIYLLNKKKIFSFYNFIGKDIIYFHTFFLISILKNTKFRLPKNIHVHGFITINGQKMSKSKNVTTEINDFTKNYNPNYLRFYFASKIKKNISDIDFSLKDFTKVINTDLISKFINIFNRVKNFIIQNEKNLIIKNKKSKDLMKEFIKIKKIIKILYQKCDYSKIIKIILNFSEKINKYLDKEKPWSLQKNKNTQKRAYIVCNTALLLFTKLISYIKYIIPNISKKIKYKIINKNLKNLICNKIKN